MTRVWRLAVPAIAALSLLACAGGAFARPQLLVTGPTATAASGMTVLEVKGAAADAAWAQLTTYVPSGYTVNLGQPVGTRIGSVSARAQLLASGATAGATGVVLVADRNDAAVQQAATQCARSPTHAGVWLMRLTLPAQTLEVPVYVDPTTGIRGRRSAARSSSSACRSPTRRACRATPPLGTKIDDLRATLSAGVFTNPLSAGSHVWRTVVMPWNSSGASQNAAATVETQGLVGVPSSLSLRAKLTTTRASADREELGASERHAARGPARRRRRHGLVLRDGPQRRHRENERDGLVRKKDPPRRSARRSG